MAHVEALADAAIPLPTVVAQRFGPLVEERLRARKRAAGLFDFDDMLLLVDEALRGPRGPELVATLRARFRLAVIDEFQDTDPVQWQIFRTIFLEAADPGRSTSSAIRSSRSTAFAAPTSARTRARAPR